MTDELELCPGCFLERRTDAGCQRCGYAHDPDAFPSALQPGAVLTKYTLGRVLGKPGGFGITYLAFDSVLRRRVAIKELMPRELVTRRPDGASVHVHTRDDGETFKLTLASFLNEARLLAQFSHPNVVRVLDYFEANGTAYFAMEYYEGQTLAEHTRRAGGRLTASDAVALMLPLLDALDHIHSLPEPILHRDIKPANIYLTDKQRPILLDFGAARVAMGQQTRSLSAVLTPGFAPYEQYSTRGKQGPWSDVYACAATLHYLVTGRMPPEANDRVDEPRIESPRSYAPDLPTHLSDAIVYGLGFKPEDRPQSASAFADLLTGRRMSPPPLTQNAPTVPAYAPIGASGLAEMPRTIAESSSRSRTMGVTEIAPGSGAEIAGAGIAPRASAQPPRLPPVTSSPARRPLNKTPIVAAVAALALVLAVVWAAGPFDARGATTPPAAQPEEPDPKTPEPSDPTPRSESPNDPIVTPPPPLDTAKTPEPSRPVGTKPPPPAAGPAAPAPEPPPPPVAPAAAPTGVLVVVRGDDADGTRQAETAILRSLVGRNGLQALDATSLSMLKGDQSAVQAATLGNFAALSAMGRQHGVELMVVGELRSRAVRSVGQFFTGTAELTVKMYRVSNSRLVDTQTFTIGQGGGQPVLAPSDGEARTRAATQAANAASESVSSWLSRAF